MKGNTSNQVWKNAPVNHFKESNITSKWECTFLEQEKKEKMLLICFYCASNFFFLLAAQELLKIKVSVEPCLVSVVVLGCSGTGEYEAGKEKITVYSLRKIRLQRWLGFKQTTGWAPPAGLTNTSSNSNLVFPGGLPSRCCPGSSLLSFSGQLVLGCRVIWLLSSVRFIWLTKLLCFNGDIQKW